MRKYMILLRSLAVPLILLLCVPAGAAPALSVTPPVGWSRWANVTVQWSYPEADATRDWVGAFLLNWNATYVKYQNITSGATGGLLIFELLNGRHPYVFRYYRDSDILAESEAIHPDGATPLQGHLTMIPGKPAYMMVSWASNRSLVTTAVAWGYSPDQLVNIAPAWSTSYSLEDFHACIGYTPTPLTIPFPDLGSKSLRCGYGCYNDSTSLSLYLNPGQLHNTTIGPFLQGTKRVYYRFGETNGLMSDVFSFVPSRPSGNNGTFSFLYTADMGIGTPAPQEVGSAVHNDPPANGADQVIAAILRDPALPTDEFLLLNGDLSYARGWPWIWERFMEMIEPVAAERPWMVTIGNHEYDYRGARNNGGDSGGECGIPATVRFHLPNLRAPWYFFDYGTLRIVTLSTEHPLAPQLDWYDATIATTDRAVTPWLVVAFHRNMYSSAGEEGDMVPFITALTPRFERDKVDMVLVGHQHFYERECALVGGVCNSTGPTYIVDGSAGAEFDPSSMTPNATFTRYKDFSHWGYSRVVVSPTTLQWMHFWTDNRMADKVTLQK